MMDFPRTAEGIWQIVVPPGFRLRGAKCIELVDEMSCAGNDVALRRNLRSREQTGDPSKGERAPAGCLGVYDCPPNMSVLETEQEIDVGERCVPDVARSVTREVDPATECNLERFGERRRILEF
jgi:hypothetical protein